MSFALDTFYNSSQWIKFRESFILQKLKEDGELIDEITHKPILKKGDAILHHKIFLTEDNVNDPNISLNPENIQLISQETHNKIHDRFKNNVKRQVFITDNEKAESGDYDLIIDLNRIYKAIGNNDFIRQTAWRLYNDLLDSVFYGFGKWKTALIIHERNIEFNRIKERLGAININGEKREIIETF